MNLNNPFEKLIQEEVEVPNMLRDRVMQDAAYAKLLLDIADLFGSGIPQSIYDTIINKHQKKK